MTRPSDGAVDSHIGAPRANLIWLIGLFMRKLWDAHVILRRDDGMSFIYIDRHLIHQVTERGGPVVHVIGPELVR